MVVVLRSPSKESSRIKVGKRSFLAQDYGASGTFEAQKQGEAAVPYDADQIYADWMEHEDPERAVAMSRTYLEQVADERIDPTLELPFLQLVVEPTWDARGGDPALVLTALKHAQKACRHAERFGGLKDQARLRLRVEALVLLARAELRAKDPRGAFNTCRAVFVHVEDWVEGADALRKTLTHATPNLVAELSVATLGIFPATLRRAGLPPVLRAQFTERGLRYVTAYLGRDGMPVFYPRTPALASQWLYLLLEDHRRGVDVDAEVIEALYRLDLRTRPTHARGQATAPLRDFEMARFRQDLTDADRQRKVAVANLEAYGLVRHQAFVEQYRYLAA
jgi:hypothetical protein